MSMGYGGVFGTRVPHPLGSIFAPSDGDATAGAGGGFGIAPTLSQMSGPPAQTAAVRASQPAPGGMFAAKPRSRGQKIAGIFSDFLAGLNGQQGRYGQMVAAERQQQQETARQEQLWQREDQRYRERQEYERSQPKVLEVGDEVVRINPLTGESTTLYQGKGKPKDAYRWRSNSGDLMEIGEDGAPRVVFDDTAPRPVFVPDGLGGGQFIAPPETRAGRLPPVGSVIPDPRKAGGAGSGPRTFPR